MAKGFQTLILVMALAGTSLAHAQDISGRQSTASAAPQATAKEQIQQAFDAWLAAVSSGSSDKVVKLYARDAVLLPTLSDKVDNTPALRKEYFDVFTAKPALKGTVNEEHIRVFGNIAVNSGLYTFSYTKDGATVTVPARFSFVYHKTPRGWLIVDHHSSKLPAAH